MRTLLVHIDGEVEPGDIVIISASDRHRGGSSNARAHVRPTRDSIQVINGRKEVVEDKASMRDLVDMIAREIATHWGAGFSARVRNDHEIVVQCESSSQDVNFSSTIEGSKRQTVTIEDLA